MSLASVISETLVSREKEARRRERRCRACMRVRVCLVVESVIDLFREEAGISGLREGSVEERERETERRMEEGKREREREKEEISLV